MTILITQPGVPIQNAISIITLALKMAGVLGVGQTA
jgi:hypothetical protein